MAEPERLRERVHNVALDFLACGLDPGKTVFFRQSDIPEVPALTWILSCLTPVGLLERCHSYKDKIARGLTPNHGLFSYPVLMAADILIYGSDIVPVGRDQKQHLEVARDLAVRFNNTYGEVLVVPEALIKDEVAVVPGLDGQKMSKSYGNTIEIFGPEKATRKRIMSIVTDSTPVEEPKPTEGNPLYHLLKVFAPAHEWPDVERAFTEGGVGYGDLKKRLWDYFMATFGSARRRYDELQKDPGEVERILAAGTATDRETAAPLMEQVRSAVGMQ